MAEPSQAVLRLIAARTNPNVPYPIAMAVAERETGFDPSPDDGAAGELGMMQILPKTAREELGYTGPFSALREPGLNLELGTGYLEKLYRRWHTWPEAIRAYNGSGPAAREYAAGVIRRIPAWEQFVRSNLELFRSAQVKRAAPWILAAVATLAVLALMAQPGRRQELEA